MHAQTLQRCTQGAQVCSRRPSAAPLPTIRIRPFTAHHECALNRRDAHSSIIAFAKKGKGKGGASAKVQEPEKAAPSKDAKDADVDLDQVAKKAKSDTEQRMQKSLDTVQNNFNTIRTGRANPLILDKVQVMYYEVPTPLKSLATVSVPDASTLRIVPFDKTVLKDMERALQESDLGLNPNNDGESIRLNFPPMTEERRKELAKQVGKMAEEGKVAVRNVRKDVIKKVVDRYDFPKDQKRDLEADVQKITDTYVKKLDDMAKAKTDELMKL